MTRSNTRFPSAQSAVSEGLQYLQAEAASAAWCYDYWCESVAPYQVILYSGDFHDEEYNGFDMIASAWACYDRVRLSPGDSLMLFDRESNVVVAQRGHTVDDEIDHCWSEHTRTGTRRVRVRLAYQTADLWARPSTLLPALAVAFQPDHGGCHAPTT